MRGRILFMVVATAVGSPVPFHLAADSRVKLNLDPSWHFQVTDSTGAPYAEQEDDSAWDIVSLPHSHEIFSANLRGFQVRGRETAWYRRKLNVPSEWLGKKLFLEFQGAMETTALWVNGKEAGQYEVSGYDSFDFDITPFIHPGKNLIAVRVDNHPNGGTPPDGVKNAYILFGGLYRDVLLHVTDPMHVTFPWEAQRAGVRLTLPKVSADEATVHAGEGVGPET